MRINLHIPDDVYRALTKRCADANTTMSHVIRSYIDQELVNPVVTARKHVKKSDMKRAQIEANRRELEAKREAVKAAAGEKTITEIAKDVGLSVSGVSRMLSRA